MGDEVLDVGVIDRDLAKLALTKEICTGVTNVGDGNRRASVVENCERRDGRAHTVLSRCRRCSVEDRDVCCGDEFRQVLYTSNLPRLSYLGRPRTRERAGDFACIVSTHTVGDDEESVARVRGVLVLRAEVPGIGRRAEPRGKVQVLGTLESNGHRTEHDDIAMAQRDRVDNGRPVDGGAVCAAFVSEPPFAAATRDFGVDSTD